MIRFINKLYYKYKLGSAYTARIAEASRLHYAVTDFTKGGRGYNDDVHGQKIRARHKEFKPVRIENPLSLKYKRP